MLTNPIRFAYSIFQEYIIPFVEKISELLEYKVGDYTVLSLMFGGAFFFYIGWIIGKFLLDIIT